MKPENFSELAALYVLDILDKSDCHLVEEAILEFPELEMELAEFRNSAGAIAYSVPDVPMAADLKERLFQRINSEITTIEALKEQATQVSWQPYLIPGIMRGTLNLDGEKREISCFIRCEANIRFPKHQHAGREEIVVLEGDLVIDGQLYTTGDRIYSLPNTIHQPETQQGCLLFVKTSFDKRTYALYKLAVIWIRVFDRFRRFP
ncbi:cupin domain-containing protein [Scytonema hofmannii FACHB-248]|uniref:Cupin domain-containing protein n=1 Tax=Scytonema hofmannii FACHB-248 TaxID=1842502 RepID=A0ABR8GP11_9CYAN|nr:MULTISPECIES: cupin domain-containing protein [Nostocales]MBD2604498.1 cupin domain-containing protein [Scytonema hofmannii FACHB-248]